MGTGKTIVEFFSADISTRLCKNLRCKAMLFFFANLGKTIASFIENDNCLASACSRKHRRAFPFSKRVLPSALILPVIANIRGSRTE